MGKKTSGLKVVADNRQAGHNYHLLDRFEAGLVLTGTEVKAARTGKVQLRDSYADIIDHEAWLMNAHFSPYSHGNITNQKRLKQMGKKDQPHPHRAAKAVAAPPRN